jgi:aspartate aminotransferase-like enzyme
MKPHETHLLLIPGPTPVPPPVARALTRPMLGHRAPEMCELYGSVEARMKQVFRTEGDILLFACSGTGGMEASISNTCSPGDSVLVISVGVFGDRYAKIARAYGMDVDVVSFAAGQAADPDVVAGHLAKAGKTYRAVTITHNETSTAVTNDTEALAKVAREHGALVLVDCISGMLCTEFAADAWGCDVVIAGSQKAFMMPPGMAFVSLSERAKAAVAESTSPRFYFDMRAMLKSAADKQTAYTPAVGLFFAADAALDLIMAEGVDAMIARHKRLGEGVRAAIKGMGLSLFADEAHASNALTSILPPEGLAADGIRKHLSSRYDIILSGGQADLKGKIFRIAHMGATTEKELFGALCALELSLLEMGHACEPGSAAKAAASVWARPGA